MQNQVAVVELALVFEMTIVDVYFKEKEYTQGNQYTQVPVRAIKQSKIYRMMCDYCGILFEKNSKDAYRFKKQKEHACSSSCAQRIFARNNPRVYKPKMKKGYVYIGKRRQHQIVIEQSIGRQLRSGECIHHINGHKADNKEENLALCSSIAQHNKIHKQLEELSMALVQAGHITFCHDCLIYYLPSMDCNCDKE